MKVSIAYVSGGLLAVIMTVALSPLAAVGGIIAGGIVMARLCR